MKTETCNSNVYDNFIFFLEKPCKLNQLLMSFGRGTSHTFVKEFFEISFEQVGKT